MSAEAPQHPGRVTRRRFLRDAAVAGAAATAAAAATQSGLVEKAINAIVDWYEPPTTRQNPEVFDQTRESIDIGSSNTLPILAAEIAKQGNSQVNLPAVENLVPFHPKDNPDQIYYRTDTSILEVPLPFEIPTNSSNIAIRRAESRLGIGSTSGVMDTIAVNGLPRGTIIYSPIDGELFFAQTKNTSGISTISSVTAKDTQGNLYSFGFQFGVSELIYPNGKQKLINTKTGSVEDTKLPNSVSVKAGDPLFRLDEKTAPGNWLADQFKMEVSASLVDPKNPNKRMKVYSPITIRTIDNKAVYIKQ